MVLYNRNERISSEIFSGFPPFYQQYTMYTEGACSLIGNENGRFGYILQYRFDSDHALSDTQSIMSVQLPRQNKNTGGALKMARVASVTRTIVTTKANVLCLDIEKGEPFNKEVILPRTYKDEKTLMKKISDLVDSDSVKAVHVVAKEEIETLYGMTEQEFIDHAKILPPRGNKKEQ